MAYKTEQRNKMYELLRSNPHKFFTAKEIAEILAPYDVSLSAIYRNLAELTETGLVKKSVKKNGREALHRYVNNDVCKDEIHMTCIKCGKIFHMDHLVSEYIQKNLGIIQGFELDKLKTVIYGTCRECIDAEKQSIK